MELERENLDFRIMCRIQSFAAFVCSMIRYSFIAEPGRPRADLREFLVEYEILENFRENVNLDADEMSQKAFDSNCLYKARNKKISCGDRNRVVLSPISRWKATDVSNNESMLHGIDFFGEINNTMNASICEDQ
jgi:hypothetical protein